MPDQPTDQDMERTAAEMEHHLEEVSEHLEEARDKAPEARVDKTLGGAAGDVSDEEGGPMFGEDPTGAVDDARAGEQEG